MRTEVALVLGLTRTVTMKKEVVLVLDLTRTVTMGKEAALLGLTRTVTMSQKNAVPSYKCRSYGERFDGTPGSNQKASDDEKQK